VDEQSGFSIDESGPPLAEPFVGAQPFVLFASPPRQVGVDAAEEQTELWVPNWSSTSCDLGVFVYQPAGQIVTSEGSWDGDAGGGND
jgi:hypothetical protein